MAMRPFPAALIAGTPRCRTPTAPDPRCWRLRASRERAPCGDVLRRHHLAQRDRRQQLLLECFLGEAEGRGLASITVHARSWTIRLDRVDADVRGAELDREALGETDDRPFRRRVRRTQAKAESPGDRRQVDDAAAPRRLEQRHRAARAVEHAVQVDGDRAVPIGDADVLDRRGRPGDPGVVDQHVETAEMRRGCVEHRVHLCRNGDVGNHSADVRARGAESAERIAIDVAGVQPGAGIGESLNERATDAGGARSDEHPKISGRCIHIHSTSLRKLMSCSNGSDGPS
jgi:hypothetical protein